MTRLLGQDIQDEQGWDIQDRTAKTEKYSRDRTVHSRQNSEDRTGQDSCKGQLDRANEIVRSGQDREDRIARKRIGHPGQDSQSRTAGKQYPDQGSLNRTS
jgi:hypothetical protein